MKQSITESLNNIFINEQDTKDIIIEELPDSQIKELIPIMERFDKATDPTSYFKYKNKTFDQKMNNILSNEHKILIAKDNNTIIGFIFGKLNPIPIGQIARFHVDKPYRGTGLADRLFNEIVSWLKSKQRPVIKINVLAGNIMARKFYAKMGFVEDIVILRNKESKSITYDII